MAHVIWNGGHVFAFLKDRYLWHNLKIRNDLKIHITKFKIILNTIELSITEKENNASIPKENKYTYNYFRNKVLRNIASKLLEMYHITDNINIATHNQIKLLFMGRNLSDYEE